MISIFAKSLRKSISKRTGKRADVVAEVSGIDKKNLDKMKLAKQLKPTMNNGSSSYCRILNWSIISRNRNMLVRGIVVEVTVIV